VFFKAEKVDNKQVLVNKYSPIVTETLPNSTPGDQNQPKAGGSVEFKETPLR
jgi:hypothetical protein